MSLIFQRRWSGYAASRILSDAGGSIPLHDGLVESDLWDYQDFRASLSLANPSLHGRLLSGDLDRRSLASLVKYASRFAFRATPTGMLGWFDHASSVHAEGYVEVHHSSSVAGGQGALNTDVKRMLILSPTAYVVDGEVRYYCREKDEARTEVLECISRTEVLDLILKHLSDSHKVTFDDMRTFVSELADCSIEDASKYVCSLEKRGLLVELKAKKPGLGKPLRLFTIDSGQAFPSVVSLLDQEETALGGQDFSSKRPLHVISRLSSAAEPPPSHIAEEVRQATAAIHSCSDPLARFKADFEHRHGGAWVPLLMVLDAEVGLPFSPKLAKVYTRSSDLSASASEVASRVRSRLDRLTNEFEIRIDDIIKDVMRRGGSATGGISLLEKNSGGREVYTLRRWSSAGIFRPVMRGLSEDDSRLLEIRRAIASHERSDLVFAEVVDIAPDSVADIARYPNFTSHVIDISGTNSGPSQSRISLGQLEVSVCSGHVVLRLAGTSTQVVPLLGNALTPGLDGGAVSSFLNLIEIQEARGFSDDWIRSVSSAEYHPSILFGSIQLSPEQWKVAASDFIRDGRMELPNVLHGRALPRFLRYGGGDRVLTLDRKSHHSISVFHEELERKGELWIEKSPNQNPYSVSSDHGEYVVCDFAGMIKGRGGRFDQFQRSGDEDWLFFEMKGTSAGLRACGARAISEALATVRDSGVTRPKWHYLFYGVTLRFRIHISRCLHQRVREAVLRSCIGAGGLSMLDVSERRYLPEFSRYGSLIDEVEDYWTFDSERRLAGLRADVAKDHSLSAVRAVLQVAQDLRCGRAKLVDRLLRARRYFQQEFGLSEEDRAYLREVRNSTRGSADVLDLVGRLCGAESDRSIVEDDEHLESRANAIEVFFHEIAHISVARLSGANPRRREWAAYETIHSLVQQISGATRAS
ncbi:lantibiotic dehydratase [Stenotrophomonas maltophilia]|nr:lantibiotic dehydratase family protein [Stenotrophomonas maltophilia]MCU1089487.1 lantibiotic dehydratase [Stenotrophomonas maltophilia]